MNKSIPALFKSCAAAMMLLCSCNYNCETAICSQLDAFKSTFDSLAENVPNGKVPDAPLAGNGDIGVTVAASDTLLRLYIGKNDFIRAYPQYVDGSGIALPGGLDIGADIISTGKYHAEQLPGSAKVKASFAGDGNVLDICLWVPATDNKVIIELTAEKRTELSLKLWAPDTYNSVNGEGVDGSVSWVTRSLGDVPVVEFRSDIAMAVNDSGGKLILEPGRKTTLAVCIYTNHDSENWKEMALSEAENFSNDTAAALAEAHEAWWSGFWNESYVNMDDPELEYWYWSSQYLLACSTRAGKFAPGLWGPFITSDYTDWAGDYHLNYNYQAPLWACYSSNHMSLTENYDKPVLDFMPEGEILARKLCGCGGVLYPVGIGPFGSSAAKWPIDPEVMNRMYGCSDTSIDGGYQMWGQKSNASFAAANMLMRFYSTYDTSYASLVFPFVAACARFYADYVREKDGRFVIVNDDFYENSPWADRQLDYNSTTALGLARMVFRGAADMCAFLDIHPDWEKTWNEAADKLADYATGINEDGRLSLKLFQRHGENGPDEDVPATGLERVSIHGLILPSGQAGPISTPKLNKILYEDISCWKAGDDDDWAHTMSNGVETCYPGAIRVGYPAEEVISHLKERIAMSSYSNGWIFQWGGGIETLSAVPMTVNEMMLQSYEGVLRIFPNWDRDIDASYKNLRAYGAFLVSASISDGEVGDVRIVSEKGRMLRMENPWPEKTVKVKRNGKDAGSFTSDYFELATAPSDVLEVIAQAE